MLLVSLGLFTLVLIIRHRWIRRGRQHGQEGRPIHGTTRATCWPLC
jgi:hypothetical protein